jgi:hypothetical protein
MSQKRDMGHPDLVDMVRADTLKSPTTFFCLLRALVKDHLIPGRTLPVWLYLLPKDEDFFHGIFTA